jgi:hypothetical protein
MPDAVSRPVRLGRNKKGIANIRCNESGSQGATAFLLQAEEFKADIK